MDQPGSRAHRGGQRSPEPPVIGCAVSETASQRLRPASTQQVVQIAGYQSGRTKNCRRRYGAGGRKPVGTGPSLPRKVGELLMFEASERHCPLKVCRLPVDRTVI